MAMPRLASLSKGRLAIVALVLVPIALLCYQSYASRRRLLSESNRPRSTSSAAVEKDAVNRLLALKQQRKHAGLARGQPRNQVFLANIPPDSLALEERTAAAKAAHKQARQKQTAEKAGQLASSQDEPHGGAEVHKDHDRPGVALSKDKPAPGKVGAKADGESDRLRRLAPKKPKKNEDDNDQQNKKPGAETRQQEPAVDTAAPTEPPTTKRRAPIRNENAKSSGSGKGRGDTEKMDFVKKMIKHAWDSYAKYAWGFNELSATTKSGSDGQGMFGNSHLGASLVDALDTLYIAGFMDEYKKGRAWVAENLDYNKIGRDVSVFEMNIRFVGSCLSMYALTGDEIYKTKAKDLVDRFMPAFRSSGLLHNWIVLNGYNQGSDRSGPCFVVAEPGTLHLEFAYLSTITGDKRYLNQVEKVRDALTSPSMTGLPGVISAEINSDTGTPCRGELSLDGGSDSYYEYLIKSYLQSGKTDHRALRLFNELADSVEKHMLGKATKHGKTYRFLGRTSGRGGSNYLDSRMGHLACFSGGMFALGAKDSAKPDEILKMGADITEACHEMYHGTATKIGPDEATFTNGDVGDGPLFSPSSAVYLLRPEVVESYFVLWRTTHDPKYREWAWEAAQAIEKYCRVDGGYTDLADVNQMPPQPNSGMQQSFFLAETLKYLYLIFTDDDVLPLDKWVFNTEAHPFPISGAFDRDFNVPFSSRPVAAASADGNRQGQSQQEQRQQQQQQGRHSERQRQPDEQRQDHQQQQQQRHQPGQVINEERGMTQGQQRGMTHTQNSREEQVEQSKEQLLKRLHELERKQGAKPSELHAQERTGNSDEGVRQQRVEARRQHNMEQRERKEGQPLRSDTMRNRGQNIQQQLAMMKQKLKENHAVMGNLAKDGSDQVKSRRRQGAELGEERRDGQQRNRQHG